MYRVAICDDEAPVRECLRGYLARYGRETGQPLEIAEFSSADALVREWPSGTDLLLLDIFMRGVDGMDAARQIRTFDQSVCIIFITTMYQRAIDGYAVRAFGFIRKPVSYAELRHELDCALRQIDFVRGQERFITLRAAGVSHRLPVSRIVYCEVRDHDMLVRMDGATSAYRYSMKELEGLLLPCGFLRCHSSYLVNPRHIRSVGQAQLVLKDGSSIPISQRRRREFLLALAERPEGQP